IERTAPQGDWRTNASRGGDVRAAVPTAAQRAAAELAASALDLDYAGVDLAEGPHGPTILEVNGNPSWRAIQEATGSDMAEEIGRKGGETVKAERGAKFYEEIGKKGGDAVNAQRGTPFYEEIGRKGGHRVRELIEKGKQKAAAAATPVVTPPVKPEGEEP